MDEDFEQELYEEPDYNVWETNRVYEDLALERAEREAEQDAERLADIVSNALKHREYDDFAPSWDDVVEDVVQALQAAGVTFTDYEIEFPH